MNTYFFQFSFKAKIQMNNTTNASESCYLALFSTDPLIMSLNIIKFVIFFLYIIWIIISLKIKEFHSKQMFFLYNLNFVGIFYLIYGLSITFYFTCYTPSKEMCFIQAIINMHIMYLNGYSIAALALHRLFCLYFVNLKSILTIRVMIISALILWNIPTVFAMVHLFVFKFVIYTGIYTQSGLCLFIIGDQPYVQYFFVIFGILVPNMIIITAYALAYFKIKSQAVLLQTRNDLHPPRLTLQIIIHVIMFEIDLVSSFLFLNLTATAQPFSFLPVFRILKWLIHFSPLAMMYFHPALIKKYKAFFVKP